MALATAAAALRSGLVRPYITRCAVRGLCDKANATPNIAARATASEKEEPAPPKAKTESKEATGGVDTTATATGQDNGRANTTNDGHVELEQLVTASLEVAKTHGWTTAALQAGATSLGWSPAAAGMVRGGGGELALYHVRRSNQAFATVLADRPAEEATLGRGAAAERVAYAVRTRLEYNAAYRHNWGSALRQLASTQPVGSARESALLADEIAHYAGYRAPNAVWYIDRAAFGHLVSRHRAVLVG